MNRNNILIFVIVAIIAAVLYCTLKNQNFMQKAKELFSTSDYFSAGGAPEWNGWQTIMPYDRFAASTAASTAPLVYNAQANAPLVYNSGPNGGNIYNKNTNTYNKACSQTIDYDLSVGVM